MKKIAIAVLSILLVSTACKKKQTSTSGSSGSGYRPIPTQSTPNHQRAGTNLTTQAYYDAKLFNINLLELSDKAAAEIIAHNKGINEIYTTKDLDDTNQDFFPVIDAVPTDGFNPMWLQEIIVFNAGYTPHQFFSDDEIDDAVTSGEIHLVNSGEVYRCSVTGTK